MRPVGLIAPAADLPPGSSRCAANGTRGIVTLGPPPEPGVPSFTLEQSRVGAVAIEHLAERGHTHVLALTPLGSQLQASARCGSRARGPRRSGSA